MKTLQTVEFHGVDETMIQELQRGEQFVLVREGIPVALLTSANDIGTYSFPEPSAEDLAVRAQALEELRVFRETHSLGPHTYRELIEDGRRY